MSLKKVKSFLYKKRGYLKKNPALVSRLTGVDIDTCIKGRKEIYAELRYASNRLKKVKRLFFDIETTPNLVYTWRIGYNITISHESIVKERRIISIHWKWAGENKVHNLTWDKDQDDRKMLQEFITILNDADEIIAHNGDRFDIKWVRTRCLYHRIEAFPMYKTLDTLKKAKSHFNFNSNKLDYISQFLGVGAKTEHEGYSLWLKVLDGDKEALKTMIEYGDNDVIILEDMYNAIMPYISPNTHHGVLAGKETTSCPNCGSNKTKLHKTVVTTAGTIQRLMRCSKCTTKYKISNSKYKKL